MFEIAILHENCQVCDEIHPNMVHQSYISLPFMKLEMQRLLIKCKGC
jgi:hypothetical protein